MARMARFYHVMIVMYRYTCCTVAGFENGQRCKHCLPMSINLSDEAKTHYQEKISAFGCNDLLSCCVEKLAEAEPEAAQLNCMTNLRNYIAFILYT